MSASSYILGQVIARGGMAEVFRGLHVGKDGFQRLVAIKRILPQHANNTEYAAMFRDEAHIGQRLQHAHIVKVEGYEVIEGSPAIVMEFVDGSDLRAVLAELEKSATMKRLPIAATLFVIAEAARGLHYAHQRRDDLSGRALEIVHRDISPQNVLISFNGEVKVTDFGIASADQDFKNTETRAGIVKGKYSYMSPEQISAKKVDPRSDVFALSIVLWEIIAMRRMFAADSEVEVIEMVKNCRLPGRLSDYNPEVTPELEAIVLKGLSRDPVKRYASMDDMERALRSYLSKTYPSFTVGDLSAMIQQTLSNRHDANQEEIKKMLTSSNLKSAAKSSISALEIELKNAEMIKGQLNVARRGGSEPIRRQNNNGSSTAVTRGPSSVITATGTRSGGYGSRTNFNKKPKTNAWLGPLWFAATILLVVVGVLFKSQMNSAKDSLSAPLRSSPPIVRIKVNAKNVQGGRYVRTPVSIRLEPGSNIIELSRSGYATETFSVDTAKGEHRSMQVVNLKARSLMFSPGRIVLAGNATLQVIVNDGFISGTLSPQQPVIEVKDLQEGSVSNILVSEKNKQAFRCRFTPPRASAKRPFILMINADRDTCELRSPHERGEP